MNHNKLDTIAIDLRLAVYADGFRLIYFSYHSFIDYKFSPTSLLI